MNDRKIALLLLVPAVALLARSRACAGGAGEMRMRAWSRRGGHGFGPRAWGQGDEGLPGFPPPIRSMLESWHRAAHAAPDGAEA